jgi:hypothetical protein
LNAETEIVPATAYVESLKQKYKGFDFPAYKLREWFSTGHQVFFDCKPEQGKALCLEQLLKRTNLEAFIIFFVVKEPNGAHRFMDASFRNLGTETLERFINRYHQQLESMTRLSIQTIGLEYVECIGHSYQEPTASTPFK